MERDSVVLVGNTDPVFVVSGVDAIPPGDVQPHTQEDLCPSSPPDCRFLDVCSCAQID